MLVRAKTEKGGETDFKVRGRLDSELEVEYYKNGGILQRFLRKLLYTKDL